MISCMPWWNVFPEWSVSYPDVSRLFVPKDWWERKENALWWVTMPCGLLAFSWRQALKKHLWRRQFPRWSCKRCFVFYPMRKIQSSRDYTKSRCEPLFSKFRDYLLCRRSLCHTEMWLFQPCETRFLTVVEPSEKKVFRHTYYLHKLKI